MGLTLHQLGLSWGENHLLSDFSFTVTPGEIALIQGPSGCGKSTLLSAIAGTAPPTLIIKGDIALDGQSIMPLAPQKRRIGILFQEALLFPHLSVAENLGFGLPSGMSRQDRLDAVKDALEASGLSGYGTYDPAHLSGGQKVRIAMMRAMLSGPRALLMDESFASLDPALRTQFGQFVADKVRKQNIPALLISHHEDDRAFATGQVITWPSLQSEVINDA